MEWQLIESDIALRELLERHRGSDAVMVDTEFMRRNTFYPQVALVQLCFTDQQERPAQAWLIDPLAIRDTEPLATLFGDTSVMKVLHSPSEDLEVFQRWLGALPQPLFDTQRAAALTDMGFGLGYRALVHAVCGEDLPKGETRSDWLQRPLSAAQCEYAAMDVTWLLPVWRELMQRCQQQDKLDWVLADGRDAVRTATVDTEDYYKRVKSAWKLDRRQLGTLDALCRWREATARRRDKPRNWIVDDKALLELARTSPRSLPQMRAAVELPPPVSRRHGDELLELIAQQADTPESQLPPVLPAPLGAAQRDRLKALKARARTIAESLSVAPEILLPGRDYELLLREASGEVLSEPLHWSGWRRQLVVEPLRAALAGGRP